MKEFVQIFKAVLSSIMIPIFLVGCISYETKGTLKKTVVKEFKLNKEAQERLYRMYTVVMDNPNAQELAFSNYRSPIGIIITNYEGKFIEKIGEEGQGPEEIQSARYFGFDNNHNIVVLDKASAFFKYFNRTSNVVTSYEYPINQSISISSRNLQQCGDNWYLAIQLIGRPTHTTVPTIGVFNSKFSLIDSLGGYDPYFKGRSGVMQETVIDVDCEAGLIFTTHAKIPFIQEYSIEQKKFIGRTDKLPPSFNISDKFVSMVFSKREFSRYLAEEQSLSLHIAHSDKYIFHVFRNGGSFDPANPNLNDRNHYVAVYSKKNLEYMGETKLNGAVLGYTKDGNLIVLGDESTFVIKFIEIDLGSG